MSPEILLLFYIVSGLMGAGIQRSTLIIQMGEASLQDTLVFGIFIVIFGPLGLLASLVNYCWAKPINLKGEENALE